MSTIMANEPEMQEVIETVSNAGWKDFIILHCVSGSPAPADQYNLETIPDMAKLNL